MEFTHLKFLLKLADLPNGRGKLSTNFKDFTPAKLKNQICQDLSSDGLVEFDGAIATVEIDALGQELVKLDASLIPFSERELKVLTKIAKTAKKLKPSAITFTLKGKALNAKERNEILEKLVKSGFTKATFEPKTGAEVWLTNEGQDCLYSLNQYFDSLRKSYTFDVGENPTKTTEIITKPSDAEVLQIIRELGTKAEIENYLPIFFLRESIPTLTKEELNQILYSLVRQKKIKLNALSESEKYTEKQISAGINQVSGGPLFFIRVVTN